MLPECKHKVPISMNCLDCQEEDDRLIEEAAARVEAKETRRPLCAKCMISKCRICGEPRDKPGGLFCSAAHPRPDILADLTAEELRHLAYKIQNDTYQVGKHAQRWTEIAERFEQAAKERGK